jgi:hypothetical protein
VQTLNEFELSRMGDTKGKVVSKLLFMGRDTGVSLAGNTLEAQLKWRDNYLLFLTEGSPFEEALHIYVLDDRFAVLDEAQLAAEYTPGALADLKVSGEDAVTFSFFDRKERWELTMLPGSRRAMSLGRDHSVKRPLSLLSRRYFDLKKSAT